VSSIKESLDNLMESKRFPWQCFLKMSESCPLSSHFSYNFRVNGIACFECASEQHIFRPSSGRNHWGNLQDGQGSKIWWCYVPMLLVQSIIFISTTPLLYCSAHVVSILLLLCPIKSHYCYYYTLTLLLLPWL